MILRTLHPSVELRNYQRPPKYLTKKQNSFYPHNSLHKGVRYKFLRRATLSYGINELWQCDLVDLKHLGKHNNGFRYLLTVIDVFSKYARVSALKMKTAEAVKNAFENLFQQAKPKNIQTDKGSEFYNSQLKSLFQRHSINHYSAEGDHKASVVERFNRTLKNKMFGVFTYRNSYKYVDILHLLVKSYNDTEHRSIGMAPSQVTRVVRTTNFSKKLYGFLEKNPKVILNKGDLVRISKANKTFRRGYLPGWSDEVFRVTKVYFSHPTTFELQDLKSEAIKGRFYAEELQKISKRSDDYWRIEKVLKTKGIGRKKEYYVKWQGFDERFNSWVKEAWMRTKLARPIILTGAWEVGLSEIFVPRTLFNIGNHNNKYSITYEETKIIEKDYAEYDIGGKIEQGTADADVIEEINQSIEEKCGHFVAFSLDRKNINVHIAPNYELHLTAANAPRLLTMLNLPREDRVIRMSESFVFRKPSKTNKDNHLKIIARNLKRHFIIRTTRFNHKYTDLENMHHELFQHINFNLMQTGIGGAADFIFDFKVNKVEITVQKNVELELRLLYAPLFMRMLSLTKDIVLKGKSMHVLQKIDRPPLNEYFRVSITDKPTVPEKVKKKTENLQLEVGFYKNAEQLFSSFKHLAFNLLANKKVKIHIPDTSAVTFQDGLKDLLGLKQSTLHGGTHISDYQLELDGGITEIYVCTDIIESHFVGDTIAPLLRIIPAMSTKEDQIVINYQRPLYLPLRQNYIDCIEVELKSSSGDGIIFTSGKSLLVLSF
ncbi:uncharacterized transposon-derived protein F54H12.3 [Trichonephila clavata]|uniref:Uncharacterized transposon-derived protein F54H12.3 n=1 Tax=Trichonephila clavata TaxID=2740835 RepID=A0A8X6JEL4_TRICU|nr:uncharacterized transposon-derived protein F54H12.3 [Trichonephila clavata]